jgi:hypothetical protein
MAAKARGARTSRLAASRQPWSVILHEAMRGDVRALSGLHPCLKRREALPRLQVFPVLANIGHRQSSGYATTSQLYYYAPVWLSAWLAWPRPPR